MMDHAGPRIAQPEHGHDLRLSVVWRDQWGRIPLWLHVGHGCTNAALSDLCLEHGANSGATVRAKTGAFVVNKKVGWVAFGNPTYS